MLKGLFSKVKEKIQSYREERRRRQEEYKARVKEGLSKLEKYDLPSTVKHELATKYASGLISGSELHSYARSLERKRKKIKRKKILSELGSRIEIDIGSGKKKGFLDKLADFGERIGDVINVEALELDLGVSPLYIGERSNRSSRRRGRRGKSRSRRRR